MTADAPGWRADDDHLHLVPGADRTIRYQSLGTARFKARFTALNTEAALTLRV